jgi:hypothetical protein
MAAKKEAMKRFPSNADELIGFGENPNGVTMITPNGVAREGVQAGHNQSWCYGGTDGSRWNCGTSSPEGSLGTPGSPQDVGPEYVGPRPWRGNMSGQ